MKMDVQGQHIFIRIVSHKDSFWQTRGKPKLRNRLLRLKLRSHVVSALARPVKESIENLAKCSCVFEKFHFKVCTRS